MNPRFVLCAAGVLLSATTALIVVGPRPLAGQTDQPQGSRGQTDRDAPPPVYHSRTAVQQVQYAQHPKQQESETTRQLRMLYATNGKQMPEMDIRKMPMVTHSPGTQNLRPIPPERQSSSRFGFLGRLFPFGRKSDPPPTYHRPQYRQPQYRQPQYRRPAGAYPYAQQQAVRQPAAPQHYAPVADAASVRADAGSIRHVTPPPQVRPTQVVRQPAAPGYYPAPWRGGIPARSISQTRDVPAPKKAEHDIPVLIDERQSKTAGTTPKPFPNVSAADADRPALPKPVTSSPPAKPAGDPGPFTGKSLADDEPKTKAEGEKRKAEGGTPTPDRRRTLNSQLSTLNSQPSNDAPVRLRIRSFQDIRTDNLKRPHPLAEPKVLQTPDRWTRAADTLPAPVRSVRSSREEKLRRIAARRGMAGFRGFCPVVLRDERELADAKSQFQSKYRGKTYFFSSANAKAAFDREPRKYAPVSAGNDVVRYRDDFDPVEGSLEHAAWYHGRLYFFASAETRQKFVRSPKSYAIAD